MVFPMFTKAAVLFFNSKQKYFFYKCLTLNFIFQLTRWGSLFMSSPPFNPTSCNNVSNFLLIKMWSTEYFICFSLPFGEVHTIVGFSLCWNRVMSTVICKLSVKWASHRINAYGSWHPPKIYAYLFERFKLLTPVGPTNRCRKGIVYGLYFPQTWEGAKQKYFECILIKQIF